MTIIASIIILFGKSIDKKSTKNYKNEIVSLGVLGTFVAVAIGLYHFDVTDIKTSMPLLLEGLKTAFITSGVGIFFSIVISLNRPLHNNKDENNTLILKALEEIVKDFNKNLTEQFGDNFKLLNESVKDMIVWQENYKTQIQNTEKSFNNVLSKLEKVELLKEEEQENIKSLISDISKSGKSMQHSLESTTDIVKEQMQLILRDANGRL